MKARSITKTVLRRFYAKSSSMLSTASALADAFAASLTAPQICCGLPPADQNVDVAGTMYKHMDVTCDIVIRVMGFCWALALDA